MTKWHSEAWWTLYFILWIQKFQVALKCERKISSISIFRETFLQFFHNIYTLIYYNIYYESLSYHKILDGGNTTKLCVYIYIFVPTFNTHYNEYFNLKTLMVNLSTSAVIHDLEWHFSEGNHFRIDNFHLIYIYTLSLYYVGWQRLYHSFTTFISHIQRALRTYIRIYDAICCIKNRYWKQVNIYILNIKK